MGPAYQGCPTLLLPFVGVGLASPSPIMSAKLRGTSELLAPRRQALLVVFCVYGGLVAWPLPISPSRFGIS